MSGLSRREALRAITASAPVASSTRLDDMRFSELFGQYVFGEREMRERLPKPAFKALKRSIENGESLPAVQADVIASAMKDWAVEMGATHFTHWFQPMTGLTAEKHDSFLNFRDGRPLFEFSGSTLIQGEPDASSFPSGGIRATFEARGYTAWDPTSPAFIRQGTNGATLCIPTAFCSWTGEALDKKTPLLRSSEALSREALRLLRLLGDEEAGRVFPTLGIEQEYFLVDAHLFKLRPDLFATGRTLMGARPPKGQELEDHYFGTISSRVLAYMEEVEIELWKLGVPVKTRHNEVAPSQFELAPLFERSTLAVDHNMLTMDVLRKTAERHGFVCLLHEKPYAGVNGSGKHNNWSMATDTGENLLEPGSTPHDNVRFLAFMTAVLRGVHLYAPLLRFSIANAGNDHRLGANEAPPAIISAYLGEELEEIVSGIVKGSNPTSREAQSLKLGVTALPPLPRHTTDRNRTSPFAFTGNKFEFRAVGSSQTVAMPNTMLNTIVADSCRHMADEIERLTKEGKKKEEAIEEVILDTLKAHQAIVFGGDNYSQEWRDEAARRGLPNLPDTVAALEAYVTDEHVALFERVGTYNRRELEARRTVHYENYAKAILIEAQTALQMAETSVLPVAMTYQGRLAESIRRARESGVELVLGPQENLLKKLVGLVNEATEAINALQATSDAIDRVDDEEVAERARQARDEVIPAMLRVRAACDSLETLVDDELWPLPKYRELLFMR